MERGCRQGVACALALLLCALCLPALAPAAEPDGSPPQAGGPLAPGGAVEGDLSREDRDFYFFYVTAPDGTAVPLAAANLGGGTSGADLDVAIEDSGGGTIAKESFVRPGEERTLAPTLAPGKYYVEVEANLGFEETYRLTPGTAAGAFGTYAEIAGRCAAARSAVDAAKAKVSRAQGRLQRAVARRRRSRFAGARSRAAARRAQARAARRVAAARARLRETRAGLEPWCSIPA